jgi:rod shape-determining protein MreC
VYDRKAIRRRRAGLAVFVALSIAILTAYFGESGGGFFHALQRGAQEAFAPVETGASRALKPVRDLFGWVGDTVDAKDKNAALEREVDALRSELARTRTAQRDAAQLKGLVGLQKEDGFPQGTEPVTARVIARAPNVWYSSVKIDKGSSDGVELEQPVIAAASGDASASTGGLAGKITKVTDGTAEVTLITDASIGVGAQVMPAGAAGVGRPARPAARSGPRRARDRQRDRRHLGLQDLGGRVALPARDPDRTRDRRRPRRGRDLSARSPAPVRRPAPNRHRSGADAPRRADPDRRGGRAVRLTPGAFVRVALLLVLAVVLQLSTLSQMPILGGHFDIVVLVVAAVAYYAGSLSGCAVGFAAGFLLDLLSGATMGASSLVLTAVGYGVGRFREMRDPSHGLLPLAVGAIATGAWVVAFAAVSFMLDVGATVSPLVLREMLVTVLLNTLLALPVFVGCRALLRPVLAVDPLEVRARRRAPREAGPLGLRGLEV